MHSPCVNTRIGVSCNYIAVLQQMEVELSRNLWLAQLPFNNNYGGKPQKK